MVLPAQPAEIVKSRNNPRAVIVDDTAHARLDGFGFGFFDGFVFFIFGIPEFDEQLKNDGCELDPAHVTFSLRGCP